MEKEVIDQSNSTKRPVCGIVMPISQMGEYTAQHWAGMLQILKEVAKDAGFKGDLVSSSDVVSVIQERIVENLYSNDIAICDVSGKNANVWFELGMRLTFDKPTVIIKDDETPYSFDASPIKHLE